MNKTEFFKMALEKLTAASNYIDTLGGVSKGYRMDIERLKAALEAKDEPVAWISPTELLVMRGNALGGAKDWRVNVGLKPEDGDVGLYTTPPQRKPLTLGQKQRLWSSVGDKPTLKDRVNAYGLAIEAAHGIKGEA